MNLEHHITSKTRALTIWLIVSLFSLLQFFLQVSGNLVTEEWMRSFHINFGQAGFLSSAFFWMYLIVQIPAGLLLDHYGPKKILPPAAIVLSMGCLLFGLSHEYFIAIAARLLMGLGAGFGFIGMVFTIAEYFPFSRFGLMLGLGEFICMLGTGIGQLISPYLILHTSWRSLFYVTGCLTLVIAALMLIFIEPHKKATQKAHIFKSTYQSLIAVVRHRNIWLSGIIGLGTFAMLTGFADLWALPFLKTVYNFSYLKASSLITWMLLGIALGGPILGKIADYFQKPKTISIVASIITFLLICIILYYPITSPTILTILLFCLGFTASTYLLAFLFAKLSVKVAYKGAGLAFCNTLALLSAVLFQPITGSILNWLKPSVISYQIALSVLPIGLLISILCLFRLKIKLHPISEDL
jgi:MFS family permease